MNYHRDLVKRLDRLESESAPRALADDRQLVEVLEQTNHGRELMKRFDTRLAALDIDPRSDGWIQAMLADSELCDLSCQMLEAAGATRGRA